MSTPKETTYNIAYEKHSIDYDANCIAYQAEIADVEANFEAAEYAAWEAYDKKQYSDNWAKSKGLAVHSKAEKSAISSERDVAIATARRSRDAAKAFVKGAHTYKVVVLDAALEAAKHASYDADAIAANIAHYKAACDAKKIAADKAAESPDKVAADKIAYTAYNDMSEAGSREFRAYLAKSHGGY